MFSFILASVLRFKGHTLYITMLSLEQITLYGCAVLLSPKSNLTLYCIQVLLHMVGSIYHMVKKSMTKTAVNQNLCTRMSLTERLTVIYLNGNLLNGAFCLVYSIYSPFFSCEFLVLSKYTYERLSYVCVS